LAPPPVAVDPAAYRTSRLEPGTIDGVDFEVGSTGIYCGVYDPYFPKSDPTMAPFVGCKPSHSTIDWPIISGPNDDPQAAVGANSVKLFGKARAIATLTSDATFSPVDGPFAQLAGGQSLTWNSVTCEVININVMCTNADSGHGFIISNEAYTLF
jgi:hypothetical protein